MSLDHSTLEALRRQHPAWRLLAAENAPLIGSFLHRALHFTALARELLTDLRQVEHNFRTLDRATLLAHALQWGDEPQPLLRDLPRLTPDEAAVFNDLRDKRLRVGVRLEQERIGFGWLQAALHP